MAKKTVALADVRQALADVGKSRVRELSDEELLEKHLWSDLELYPEEISDILYSLKEKGLWVNHQVEREISGGGDMTVRQFIRSAVLNS